MSNGEVLLAPTPIVRITAEQLEYLIARLRGDEWSEKKAWRVRTSSISQSLGAQVTQLVGIDETRVGLLVWSTTQNCWLAPTGQSAVNTGIPINAGFSTGQQALMRDEWGWQMTRGWEAFNTPATTVYSIVEIFGKIAWAI